MPYSEPTAHQVLQKALKAHKLKNEAAKHKRRLDDLVSEVEETKQLMWSCILEANSLGLGTVELANFVGLRRQRVTEVVTAAKLLATDLQRDT
jgi:hypothetical protein